jgi:GT2 family glycosyltransferase
VVRRSRWRPLKFDLIEPGEQVKRCDTINGNCVLIPRNVVQVVGNLDPAFTHYAGDWDYGLRAAQQGCSVWVAPGYVGTCSQNYQPGSTVSSQVQWSEGLKKIAQPKGLAVREQTFTHWENGRFLPRGMLGRFGHFLVNSLSTIIVDFTEGWSLQRPS